MLPGSITPCSLYLSPNGHIFRTMEEVQEYNRHLEKKKIEGEQKQMVLEAARKAITRTSEAPVNHGGKVYQRYEENIESMATKGKVVVGDTNSSKESNKTIFKYEKNFFDEAVGEFEIRVPGGSHVGRRFQCTECPKQLNTKNSLDYHLRTHTGLSPFQCDICFKKFKSSSLCSRHRKIHSIEKKYSCDYCSKKYSCD